jgi:anti-anti-sigma factor
MVQAGTSFLSVSESTTRAGPEGGTSVVWLRGEHDSSTMAAVSDTLARAIALDEPSVIIDLSEVQFMSTSIVGVIVRASQILRRRSRSLTLRAPPSCVWRAFDACGLFGLLDPGYSLNAMTPTSALATWVEVPPAGRVDRHEAASAPPPGMGVGRAQADEVSDADLASSSDQPRPARLKNVVGHGRR